MARPTRQGIDYFSLDVHLDDKFKFIEIKYKLEGFAIIMKLLQKIYSSSYWYKWTDDEALLFADENRTDYSLVKNVVQEAVERGIFNQELYEMHGILTSKGIQKRYKEAVRRRKEVEIMSEYLLIDDDFGVNDGNNSPNDDIKPTPSKHNDGKSTQSKVNESKVNEIKKDIIPFDEIINFLNAKAETSYRSSSKKTQQHINARIKDGFTLNDFKTVIDKKVTEWINDESMSKFIRPETLFGTKFESYLNQKKVANGFKVASGQVDFDSLRRELEDEQNTGITYHPNNNDILPRKI
ncbi:MAG TPA: conserved phage C-terminal domain-containing protein [Paenisporosarcina sp.]|nr:conserved phage C-terminal domain-containing protein [Paenisporosarcina sp.]